MTSASLIGATLGGYDVQAILGTGGMATVYHGLDRHLQRDVAIKILATHAAAMPGFTDRFRQEARLIANLRHPNIVQIYAFGEERGLTYMVQELLPGPTLEQRIADTVQLGQHLPPDEILRIITQLAAALDTAHAAGVIHRDVKPSNALWNAAGALVLTDFGIAKDNAAAITQTQAGLVMGTPTYMAPEQGQGLPLTHATDTYALGVVLFEMLAGQVPFAATTPLAVVLQHIQDPPPSLMGLRTDLPAAVEAVVQRALAKNPAQRFASAGAFAAALEQAWTLPAVPLHQLPTQAWTPPVAPARLAPAPPTAPLAAPPLPVQPAPLGSPWPGSAQQRSISLLPVLGVLLVLVFIAGAFLAFHSERAATAESTPQPAATAVSSAVDAAPTQQSELVTPETIAETVVPIVSPASTPMAQVRALLARPNAGPDSPVLLAALDQAQQALDQGDTTGAAVRLAELQRTLLTKTRAGTLKPELLRQVLSGIATIADDYALTLPLVVSAD